MKRDEKEWETSANSGSSSIVVDSGTGPGLKEAHSAYDVEAAGVLRAGDRAPDAPELVKVNFENQKSRQGSSSS